MPNLAPTPLTGWHEAAGARMGPFAGHLMPIQYRGILDEHQHTRRAASAFDTCHMGEFDLRGPDAGEDLERLLTLRVATLRVGQCRYGFLCNEAGGVIDDLTCYRRGEDRYTLVVNAGTREADASHIRAHLSPGTRFEDRSQGRAKFDVQGPRSRALVEAALGQPLPDLKYFRCVDWTAGDTPVLLSRTGYTGEWGYEFYLADQRCVELWERLLAPGDIRPAGLGARDTLRLEMGYPLHGHELDADTSPIVATGGAFVDLGKDFVGRAAMDTEPARRLTGLLLEGKRAARRGDAVFAGDAEVGRVTSGSFAPSLGAAVALAYLDTDAPDRVEIEVRGKRLPARRAKPPFYKDGSARG